MDFAFSAEQEMLRAAARDYLTDRYPIDRVISLIDSDEGWDPKSWREIADLGWLDRDLGFLEQAVIFEETGYALFPAPYFSTVGLSWPLLDDELADAVSAGDRSVTVATDRNFVPDLGIVTDVLVVADDGIYALETGNVPITTLSTVDRSRRYGELKTDATTGRRLANDEALHEVRRRALAALSCEAVGVAQRALDFAAAYAKERQQFGRPIGSFQAVSHRISNIYMNVQLARSLAYWAAWTVAEDDVNADLACAAAKAAAGEAAVFACEDAIQSLGGIGFTWEHPLHRFYKRAQWIDSFDGFGTTQRARIAAALLD